MPVKLGISGFVWDAGNEAKCRKHGLSRTDIEEALSGELLVLTDPKHSILEERLIGIGQTRQGRHIFVAFTLRKTGGQTSIRPISARYMHKKEIAAYEKARSTVQKRPSGGSIP